MPSKEVCIKEVYGQLVHCVAKGLGGARNVKVLPRKGDVGISERGGEGRGRFLLLGERVG